MNNQSGNDSGRIPSSLDDDVMTEFLIMDYPSTFNRVIGRLLLKVLKVVTSIYQLTTKFPTAKGSRQVRGSQYDSRECYNKSLGLVEKEKKLPQVMEVERLSVGPMKNKH